MSSQTPTRWVLHNNLKNASIGVSHFQRGRRPQFDELITGQSRVIMSTGSDGRIAIRIRKPHRYRILFDDNDFPGWIEVDPIDQQYSTVSFPNGKDTDNNQIGFAHTVTVADPE